MQINANVVSSKRDSDIVGELVRNGQSVEQALCNDQTPSGMKGWLAPHQRSGQSDRNNILGCLCWAVPDGSQDRHCEMAGRPDVWKVKMIWEKAGNLVERHNENPCTIAGNCQWNDQTHFENTESTASQQSLAIVIICQISGSEYHYIVTGGDS